MLFVEPPPMNKPLVRLPADPTFEEIKSAGGAPDLHAEAHTVSNGQVWVSGEIPRTAEWESGLIGSIQWVDGKWQADEVGHDRVCELSMRGTEARITHPAY